MEVKYFDDRTEYRQNGKLHREDGPAFETVRGTREWHLDGTRHREDGPAIEWFNGLKEWYRNGQLHRENGPAYISSTGHKYWYQNDKLHRLDGPAVEWKNGIFGYINSWFLHSVTLSESAYLIIRSIEITIAISPLQLPAYVVLWIHEWINPNITKLNQPKLVQMIQNLRNSYRRKAIKN